jgi:hypothetical protein
MLVLLPREPREFSSIDDYAATGFRDVAMRRALG